jgi:hypothetical protein
MSRSIDTDDDTHFTTGIRAPACRRKRERATPQLLASTMPSVRERALT